MTATPTPPWVGKDLPYMARLGLMLLNAVLLIIAIVGFFIAFSTATSVLSGRTQPNQVTTDLLFAVVGGGLCIACIGGLIVIVPYTRGPAGFITTYGAIPATVVAHPFEVRFQRYLWGRSLRGKGTVQFNSEALSVSGYREPHVLFQLGIVLLITILPQVLFGFGLGIVPALIIGYFIGRKQVTLLLPYTSLRDLQVKGRQVTMRTDQSPAVISFAVAASDGERLYRELQPRFPSALGGWVS